MGKPYGRSCVLITGATTGIGYELAKLYAKDKNNLILVARNEERLKEVKDELSLYSINVYTISLDLSEDNSCEKVLDFVNKNNLSVDILINNAGIGSFGYLSEIEMERELKLIDVNIRALTELTKGFLPIMIDHGEGAIMNVASTAAFCAGPKMATYYASKSYVLNFTEALHEEVKGNNIKVSCLCPGPVKTNFQERSGIRKKGAAKKALMTPKEVAKIAYRDFKKGKLIIIPGFKNKLIITLNKLMPRSLSRKIIFMMNKG
ncbi:SDR family oxidoreductase [Clostridium sp. AL.422]|uniref:SDR family NAD(P)-dependent oxidoreductase n=1 Tax=Clostridium TaxID=1485 RepID=UPI00293DB7D1|nr:MULTISPECIES: SDR family oxidoreductase [unclassified Clostridium]MDV4152349.1 SDR family oxidoreductase [Clostridium sp. AL.422]